jgi:hypothetical protein
MDYKEQIIKFIEEEKDRIQYGKLYIEITITKGNTTNIQAETKRSMNVDLQKD